MERGCLGCGRPIPASGPRYCSRRECQAKASARPDNAHWSSWRNSKEQNQFRHALMERYGGQCTAIGPWADTDESGDLTVRCPEWVEVFTDLLPGVRCTERRWSQLDAHHGGKRGEPDLLLCNRHHTMLDPHARRR